MGPHKTEQQVGALSFLGLQFLSPPTSLEHQERPEVGEVSGTAHRVQVREGSRTAGHWGWTCLAFQVGVLPLCLSSPPCRGPQGPPPCWASQVCAHGTWLTELPWPISLQQSPAGRGQFSSACRPGGQLPRAQTQARPRVSCVTSGKSPSLSQPLAALKNGDPFLPVEAVVRVIDDVCEAISSHPCTPQVPRSFQSRVPGFPLESGGGPRTMVGKRQTCPKQVS